MFRTDLHALALGGASLLRDFTLGSLFGWTGTYGLLDTSPLAALLERALPPNGIAQRDRARRSSTPSRCRRPAITRAARTRSSRAGRATPIWSKSRRVVLPVTLTHRHILASGAIPIVFPPVRLDSGAGELWFGDGGMRLVAPLSPAIRLGATPPAGDRRALVARAADTLGAARGGVGPPAACPPLAQICGVFLNAIFLDHLDTDLDHLRRMNELVAAHAGNGAREPMRRITPLVISPSEDLALVAQRFAYRMPRLLRFVLDGLGTPDAQSADLMSYLLFDSAYTSTLVDIGYRDADARIGEIEALI